MIRTFLLTCFFVSITTLAGAEYYKYHDENGNLRFTDDISTIPESQRKSVEQFESTTSNIRETPTNPTTRTPPAEAVVPPGDVSYTVRAKELNRIQEKLHKTRMALEKEKAELEARAPAENATNKEKIAYSEKIEALNAKIDQYSKEVNAFEEKVDAFNRRGKSSTKPTGE
jgi:predicted RNase H-like nuclease (RuvC/YqgF family)